MWAGKLARQLWHLDMGMAWSTAEWSQRDSFCSLQPVVEWEPVQHRFNAIFAEITAVSIHHPQWLIMHSIKHHWVCVSSWWITEASLYSPKFSHPKTSPNQLELPVGWDREVSASPPGSPSSTEFLKGYTVPSISHGRRAPLRVNGNTE